MAGTHCDGARKNGNRISAGPDPSIWYEMPAWMPAFGAAGRGVSAWRAPRNAMTRSAISWVRSATASLQLPGASYPARTERWAAGSRTAARGGFGRRPVLARDHQNAGGDIGERCRIEPARHTQHDAGEPLGMFYRHARDVARDRGAEMRRAEAEVIHQSDQPIGRRQVRYF